MISNSSWLYPIKGIYYFAAHPFLYPLLRARLLPSLLLSIFVLTNLFLWTYLPQVAFLAIFHGPLAWVNGAFLVLGEGAAITALLFEAFFVDETLVDVFDSVLINEGLSDLVARQRTLHPEKDSPVKQLGKPTRYRAGPLQHWRYFKLLGFTKKERNSYTKKRKLRYTWFGTVALLLQLVPVLSMLFLLTTATGSALWVVKLEEQCAVMDNERLTESEHADAPV
ncbi:hypothetical protein MMC06_005557 [Schaereria dolodes]|nr:hypothetical protein [Schaereria dolodes]